MENYNGCPYCKPNSEGNVERLDSLTNYNSGIEVLGIAIKHENNGFYIRVYGRDPIRFEQIESIRIPIYYCPICGRKLE